MSWMDSWSRPSKSQAIPPPFYLTQGYSVKYCHTCGRVIGSRRVNNSKSSSNEAKYCSDKCKHSKPSTALDSLDVRIEKAIEALLSGKDPEDQHAEGQQASSLRAKPKQKAKKGDPRIVIKISDIEFAVFGNQKDPEKVFGRRKDRARRGVPDSDEWKSVDMEASSQPNGAQIIEEFSNDEHDDHSDDGGVILLPTHVRPPQTDSDINFSVGGERGWSERIDETPEMLHKRREGQKRADEQALVKNAARRAVVFGILTDAPIDRSKKKSKNVDPESEGAVRIRRKCEVLMNDTVVEPSFAKGDWSIRWRED